MMGPDYTHWHGTYDVAKTFYAHYVPELRKMVAEGLGSGDEARVQAARRLDSKLTAVLESTDHNWFIGQMSPEEEARRKKAAEEFKSRYKD
jgi:hypothetical protein